MERRGKNVIDFRTNARSRRDDRKITNADFTYKAEKLGHELVFFARKTRMELLQLGAEGDDAA